MFVAYIYQNVKLNLAVTLLSPQASITQGEDGALRAVRHAEGALAKLLVGQRSSEAGITF